MKEFGDLIYYEVIGIRARPTCSSWSPPLDRFARYGFITRPRSGRSIR